MMAGAKTGAKAGKAGAPPKLESEKSRLVTSSYRAGVLAMFAEYGDGSISRGARVAAEREYKRWAKAKRQ